MKIKVEGKELKGIIEKALCNMDKKTAVSILHKIILSDDGNKLTAYTSDITNYLQVSTKNYTSITPGSIGIDEKDLKVLLKMNDDVIITEIDDSILVQSGKKSISLAKYDISDFPCLPQGEFTDVLKFKENNFNETINNLMTFTSDNENNKIMQCLHFNMIENRIESLDGHRIGMKAISDHEKIADNVNLLVNNSIVPCLKKVLDKKSESHVILSYSDKYIKVVGKDFLYIQLRVDGEYYKVSQMLRNDYDFTFKAETEAILQHLKYYTDNVIEKSDKNLIILKIEKDYINTYGRNTRFEVSDIFEIKNHTGNNITIAFNPYFLVDALKYSDTEEVSISGNNPRSSIIIEADKYSFVILPVNVYTEDIERMERYLGKVNVA